MLRVKIKKSIIFFLNLFSLSLYGYTNKTYLRNLDHQFINPTESVSLFAAKQTEKVHARSDLGASFFYYQSTNGSAMGRYFGCNDKNNVTVGNNISNLDVTLDYLIHKYYAPEGDRVSYVNLKPKLTEYGVDLYYIYDLVKFLKNFYFKIDIPIKHVSNNIKMGFNSTGFPEDEDPLIVKNYLMGVYEDLTGEQYQQYKLTKLKFAGKKSKTGFSDIDISLGYSVLNKRKEFIYLFADLVIPVSNKPKGEYLFEPILGNNKHWALGIGEQSFFNLLNFKNGYLDFFFNLNYKYYFSNKQKRAVSIKSPSISGLNWGEYYLIGEKNQQNQPLIPAANIFTSDITVCPGNQFDGDLKILLNFCKFDFDLGLSFLYSQDEDIKIKNNFINKEYAVAKTDYTIDHAFDITQIAPGFYWIDNKNLDKESVRSPAIISYKLYGEIGRMINWGSLNFNLLFGGGYNFVIQNNNFQGFNLKFKLDFLF